MVGMLIVIYDLGHVEYHTATGFIDFLALAYISERSRNTPHSRHTFAVENYSCQFVSHDDGCEHLEPGVLNSPDLGDIYSQCVARRKQ